MKPQVAAAATTSSASPSPSPPAPPSPASSPASLPSPDAAAAAAVVPAPTSPHYLAIAVTVATPPSTLSPSDPVVPLLKSSSHPRTLIRRALLWASGDCGTHGPTQGQTMTSSPHYILSTTTCLRTLPPCRTAAAAATTSPRTPIRSTRAPSRHSMLPPSLRTRSGLAGKVFHSVIRCNDAWSVSKIPC